MTVPTFTRNTPVLTAAGQWFVTGLLAGERGHGTAAGGRGSAPERVRPGRVRHRTVRRRHRGRVRKANPCRNSTRRSPTPPEFGGERWADTGVETRPGVGREALVARWPVRRRGGSSGWIAPHERVPSDATPRSADTTRDAHAPRQVLEASGVVTVVGQAPGHGGGRTSPAPSSRRNTGDSGNSSGLGSLSALPTACPVFSCPTVSVTLASECSGLRSVWHRQCSVSGTRSARRGPSPERSDGHDTGIAAPAARAKACCSERAGPFVCRCGISTGPKAIARRSRNA
jgi:hypothetical protein